MLRWRTGILLLLFSLLLLVMPSGPTAQAQGSSQSCPAIVESALSALGEVCGGLGRNQACYGHNRVDATFWLPQQEAVFSAPADRVPLFELQTVATAPLSVDEELWGLALLSVQANLPQTLPGQAVTFLLMGDATLANAVPPEEALQPATPVDGTTLSPSNLRSSPTTAANVVASVPAGTLLELVGVNQARDWYEVVLPQGGTAWIWGQLVQVADFDRLNSLPVTYGQGGAPRYGPMQAFYFTTGLGAPTCAQAPNALVVQSTELAQVTLSVNELQVQLGSTVVFTTTVTPRGTGRALVATLLDGRLQTLVNGVRVVLTRPGQSLAVSLNEQGLVDRNSRPLQLRDPALQSLVQQACRNALLAAVFELPLDPALCDAPLVYYQPPPPPTPVPATPVPTTPPQPSTTISFGADRDTINLGECVTLSWAVEGVQAVYFQGQGVTGHESRQVCPTYHTTYTLNVITPDGQTISRSVTITVLGGYTISFVADRYSIAYGQCATLSWAVEGVQAVFYEGRGVTGTGSQQECPYSTTTYTLTVITTTGEQILKTVTIEVGPG